MNCRVLSYLSNASSGTVVAGLGGCGSTLNRLGGAVRFVHVDANESVYIVDIGNNRVMRWTKRASQRVIVVGNRPSGNSSSQLNYPYGVSVDSSANVYVTDYNSQCAMKWAAGAVIGGVTGVSGR